MQQIYIINPDDITEEEAAHFRVREAARAVVEDDQSRIALLRVTAAGYYKLPGGGMKKGEDRVAALQRECHEELGCAIAVIGEVGSIVEYRREKRLKQISYCYHARVVGEKGTPRFTSIEMAKGFVVTWITLDDAQRIMERCTAVDDEGGTFIVPRDTLFLRVAKNLLIHH